MRLLLLLPLTQCFLTAATVHQGTIGPLTGPGSLDASGVITAGSLYDENAGSSADGIRVTGGIDFGDAYTPINSSFTGNITGVQDGSSSIVPNFGDAGLNQVLRTQGYGGQVAIDFPLPAGTYKIQLLFWEPYFGVNVGGGTGSWSIAVARKYPHMEATVLELPTVADIAREHVAAAGTVPDMPGCWRTAGRPDAGRSRATRA